MTSHQHRAGEHAEILALVPDASAAEADALLALFSAAAGPPTTGRLPGEDAAVAAFRAVRPGPAAARRARILAVLTGVFTLKTAAVALAFTSVGGAALAASTGVLPTPLTDTKSHVEQSDPPRAGADVVRAAARAAVAADLAGHRTGRSTEASYSGLCQAFTAGAWTNERAAGNPAFTRLVETAPAGDVSAFCTALAAEASHPSGRIPPGQTGSDTTKEAARDAAKGTSERGVEARERGRENGNAPATRGGGQPADRSSATADRAGPEDKAADPDRTTRPDRTAGPGQAPSKPVVAERGKRPIDR